MFNSLSLIEVAAIALEILGMSLMLSMLVIYSLFLRPHAGYFREKADAKEVLENRFRTIALASLLLGISGVAVYLIFQSMNLSAASNISFSQAFGVFSKTTAGSFAVYRGLITLAFFVFLWFRQRKIFDSEKLTVNEILLFLLIFANLFLRSRVSISDLYSYQSFFIAVNLVNLIFKSLWTGSLIVFGFAVMPVISRINLHNFTAKMFLKLSRLITWVILVGGTTSIYLNWLYLRDPVSFFSTEWGTRFLILMLSVLALGGLRLYHIFITDRKIAKGIYQDEIDSIKYTFPMETSLSVLVLIFSSFLIIVALPVDKVGVDFNFQYLDNLTTFIINSGAIGSLGAISIFTAIIISILSAILFFYIRNQENTMQDKGGYTVSLPETKQWLGALLFVVFMIFIYI